MGFVGRCVVTMTSMTKENNDNNKTNSRLTYKTQYERTRYQGGRAGVGGSESDSGGGGG